MFIMHLWSILVPPHTIIITTIMPPPLIIPLNMPFTLKRNSHLLPTASSTATLFPPLLPEENITDLIRGTLLPHLPHPHRASILDMRWRGSLPPPHLLLFPNAAKMCWVLCSPRQPRPSGLSPNLQPKYWRLPSWLLRHSTKSSPNLLRRKPRANWIGSSRP